MADHSGIEWTDATWNPVTGCTKVSAGCKNCYAEALAARLKAMGNPRYKNGFEVTLHPDLLDLPRRWRAPRKVFVNSMSDLFHPEIPDSFIRDVFDVMVECDQHQFQILTKRPERVAKMAKQLPWPANVWQGTSIEDNRVAGRADELRHVPAAVRFISFEPLIGPVDEVPLDGIDWAIAGGESGPKARPIQKKWVRDLRRRCRKEDVAFFFKQWGGRFHNENGRTLDGRRYDEYPTPQPRWNAGGAPV